MARVDPHSYFDDAQPRTRAWRLRLAVDFERKVLSGTAALELGEPGAGPLDFDTRGLTVKAARADGRAIAFHLGAEEPILGRRLRVELPVGTRAVEFDYETSPSASGL